MELADMQDLGSCAARRMGSTPFIRTNHKNPVAVMAAGFLHADIEWTLH